MAVVTLEQQGDVCLFQTTDDGDILVEGGVVAMTGDLTVAAYLSLFGGNEKDDGSQDTNKQWWGNADELDADKTYRSLTQNLLQSLPINSANLRKVEEAVRGDLEWMRAQGIANVIEVVATIPQLNRILITITINADEDEQQISFLENWRAFESGT